MLEGIDISNTPDIEVSGGGTVPKAPAAPPVLIPVATVIDNYASGILGSQRAEDWWPGYWDDRAGIWTYRRWKYILQWQEAEPSDEERIAAAMDDALAKWIDYELLIDPRPTLGSIVAGKVIRTAPDIFDVAVNKKLKDGVVFMRYIDLYMFDYTRGPASVENWRALNATYFSYRPAAYNDALKYFQDILARIAQSPYKDDADSPLSKLYTRIANFIKKGPKEVPNDFLGYDGTAWAQGNDGFYWYDPVSGNPSTTSVSIDPQYSGPLYEIYFGFMPETNGMNYEYPDRALYPQEQE
jgi:hypothetical protein